MLVDETIFKLIYTLTNANEFDAFIFHVCKHQVKVHHFMCSDLWCLLIPSDLFVCKVFQQFDQQCTISQINTEVIDGRARITAFGAS